MGPLGPPWGPIGPIGAHWGPGVAGSVRGFFFTSKKFCPVKVLTIFFDDFFKNAFFPIFSVKKSKKSIFWLIFIGKTDQLASRPGPAHVRHTQVHVGAKNVDFSLVL